MKRATEIEKADWIITRVLVSAAKANTAVLVDLDCVKAVSYLCNKYTDKTISNAIDAIRAERKAHCDY